MYQTVIILASIFISIVVTVIFSVLANNKSEQIIDNSNSLQYNETKIQTVLHMIKLLCDNAICKTFNYNYYTATIATALNNGYKTI